MSDSSLGNAKTRERPAAAAPNTLAPGTVLGQYRILRLLGRGGMGEVYEAEHQVLRRRYAMKLLPATLDWRGVGLERFQREAQVMANLEHPNIIRVDEFGETDGRYWLRMELAGGVECSVTGDQCSGKKVVSLQDLADAQGGKIPQNELLAILKQVLAGLDYAHTHGAIHRDLKPSNILLFPSPQSPTTPLIKITDFGLVRLVGEDWVRSQAQLTVQRSLSLGDQPTMGKAESEGTSTRSLLGTYEYMSPEQKRGEEADARSDLYAVGLMTFKLLTGRNPGTKPPSRIDQSLAPGWDVLVEKALGEERSERLVSATSALQFVDKVGTQIEEVADRARAAEDARKRQEEKRRNALEKARLEEELRLSAALEVRTREQERKQQPPPLLSKSPDSFGKIMGWVLGLGSLAIIGFKSLENSYPKPPALPLSAFSRVASPKPQVISTTEYQQSRTLDLGGGVTMDLVWIPAGSFIMGSPENEAGRSSYEGPQQQVRISEGFWIGKYEVTQEQWQRVMGNNPSNFKGPKNPVETVSWTEAKEFCAKAGGRLPTEAEWEYACRAGTETAYSFGSDASMLQRYGNYCDRNCAYDWNDKNVNDGHEKTAPVGSYKPNDWGLYDMHGNVWEWCGDWYADKLPPGGVGPASGLFRVYRGGCWANEARFCRLADRFCDVSGWREDSLGFRLVRSSL